MGQLSRRRPMPPGLFAKSRRYAMPSAFVTAGRAAIDALPARHWLSRRPCRSPGGHAHLSAIFYAKENL
ncbi:hypothetical protein DDT56_09605 [Brenneria corticis]|uniref:Uncharacterized protein n=1 Tax=Brenneria corticis TaxID=2173106 RepID=A0A2U1U4C6_9GAMM|nr:hypothetical protein DDT56_09605 [Brenneria sp. CFCC 11842]